ncbi:hypothetical protein BDZ89DRAFT_1057937, partial [Hymenopellis radicata]
MLKSSLTETVFPYPEKYFEAVATCVLGVDGVARKLVHAEELPGSQRQARELETPVRVIFHVIHLVAAKKSIQRSENSMAL